MVWLLCKEEWVCGFLGYEGGYWEDMGKGMIGWSGLIEFV